MYRITCRSVVSSSLKCQIIRWSQHENGVHGEYVMRTWISPNRVKSNCVDSSNIHNVGQSNLCYLLLTRVELEVKKKYLQDVTMDTVYYWHASTLILKMGCSRASWDR
jgi:hypothetical protein